jgi:hypothetical protein
MTRQRMTAEVRLNASNAEHFCASGQQIGYFNRLLRPRYMAKTLEPAISGATITQNLENVGSVAWHGGRYARHVRFRLFVWRCLSGSIIAPVSTSRS